VEPDEIFDERVDHVFVAGRAGPDLNAPVVINGQQAPLYVWKAGTRHRVRLINITPNDTVEVSLRTNAGLVAWRQLSKDGATLSMEHSTPVAASQLIGVGETYDFEVDLPAGRRSFWLEVRSSGGKWLAQGQVIVQ
jgi:hypothetical protein